MWLTGPVARRHVGSSQTRARTRVPCIGRQILNHCATREAPYVWFCFVLFCFLSFGVCLFVYLFIYCCAGSSFLREGSLQLRQAGATPHRGARASHHRGPSCRGAQAPDTRRPSNCGPRAQPLRGTRDPPRPGFEPMSPALAGRLPTTAPPGKPHMYVLIGLSGDPMEIP